MGSSTASLPNPDSRRLLASAVRRSGRSTGVQLPIGFIKADGADAPPLARMLRGGRGGEVRLKLYLSLSLLATQKPYDIRRPIPARVWAAMLALDAPEVAGARRVADALTWLADAKLIDLTRAPGTPPTIKLRNPTGDGKAYRRPRGRWVSVPLDFWSNEWITHLSGSAVALLLVLLELQGGVESAKDAPSASGDRRRQYALSDDTWTRAGRELIGQKLLTVHKRPQDQDFDWERVRNTYWVDKDRLRATPRLPEAARE